MDLKTLEAWFSKHFHGSAVARSEEAWKVAHDAFEELKAMVVSEVVAVEHEIDPSAS